MTRQSETGVELTPEQTALVREASARLAREFDGTFDVETIEQYVASTQGILQSSAKFTMWLPVLIERLTRDRLRAIARGAHAQQLVPQ